MEKLERDIERASESEIVLSQFVGAKWIPRILSVLTGISICAMLGSLLDDFDAFYIFMIFTMALFTVICWQMLARVTVIQFNQPMGYLTIKESPWWSICIPAGPSLIKVSTQVPLPKSSPFVEDHSGLMTYPVRTGPDTVEIRQSYINRFQVQLPLDNGKVYTLWTTSDRNTYIEIISRINKAIQDCNQMS